VAGGTGRRPDRAVGRDAGRGGCGTAGGDDRAGRALATRLAGLFPGRFYIELQRAGLPGNEAHVPAAVALAAQLPAGGGHAPDPVPGADDFEAHEARVCIAEGETLANPRRVKRFTREQYFKTQAQMAALFADLPSALANTVEIARRCNLQLVLGKPQLPDFPTPLVNGQRMAPDDYFRQASHEGLEKRLARCFPTPRGATRSVRAMWSGWSSSWPPSSRWASRATS
jgi:DNA polymerase-3 subunit alpha